MKKKRIAILIAMMSAFLCACGNNTQGDETVENNTVNETTETGMSEEDMSMFASGIAALT